MSSEVVTTEDYLAQSQALLPEGPAWPRDPDATLTKLLRALSAEFARVHNRANVLLEEMNPLFSLEMLADWERVCGLPDTCYVPDRNLSIQERRTAVINKLNSRGGQSLGYFKGIAEAYGYTVEIHEFRPFTCGDTCGSLLGGPHTNRYYWRVAVTGPRVTYFRTGESQCGDTLAIISRAEDLECIFNRLKPAHSILIFAYEGGI